MPLKTQIPRVDHNIIENSKLEFGQGFRPLESESFKIENIQRSF